jgi:hypothetical protein
VAHEPEPVGRLEVVAGGRLPVSVAAVCHERAPEGADGRNRRDDRGRDVER